MYQRSLSALERATRRKTITCVHDISTQTKRCERVEKFKVVDDFKDTPSVCTAGSRPWSTQAASLQPGRSARSHRTLHESGAMHSLRLHLEPTDPHHVSEGFLPTQVRGWLLLRNSRLGPQERAAILSAAYGDTGFSKVFEKLRSQWSDSDLAVHDRRGKSMNHDGHRKGHDRRHGKAHQMDLSDEDGEQTSHEQPPDTRRWSILK